MAGQTDSPVQIVRWLPLRITRADVEHDGTEHELLDGFQVLGDAFTVLGVLGPVPVWL